MTKKEKAKEIMKRLYKVFPDPKTELIYKNPFELLIATILSAQATDVSVNLATPTLFAKFPTPQKLAAADLAEIDKLISKINFHQNKTKMIQRTAQMLVDNFAGKVPDNMKDLITLSGVARKTANVVLGNAFGKNEGVVVDTHVMRLSQKLGLTDQKDPKKIEQDLMKIVPQDKWADFSNLLILFGRRYCPARPHECSNCPLGDLCPDK